MVVSDIKIGELQNNLLSVQNSLNAINNFASGLSFAIPSERVLKSYTDIIATQKDTLSSVLEISEKFKIKNDEVASLLDTAVLPLNGAITEIGLFSANSSKLHSLGSISLDQLDYANRISGLALSTLQEQQDIVTSGIASIESSGALRTISEMAPALQTISGGVSEMMRSLPIYPLGAELVLPEFETISKETEIDESNIFDHQKKLDALLEQINPDLIEFRKGVWKAFNEKGADYIGQASSSMRRLVDTLLREIAPSDKVTKTNFFEASPEAKDTKERPTRKARIMFVVDWDQNKSDRLERLAKGFLESYDNLPAWDHQPLKKDSFVHGVFITIEGYLISILSENRG